jgi:uncharacterized protein (TIGR03118 family)
MQTIVQNLTKARFAAAPLLAVLLAACGGYGGGGSYNGAAPAPTATLSVAPTSIVLGQSATLTWSSTNSSSCTASGAWSGDQAASGTSVQTPTAVGTLTFTLTCTGANAGSAAKSATLTVTAPTAFTVTNLVADTAGTAALTTDAHLVNPWGIAFGPTTAIWVANNRSAAATQYDGNGKAQPTAAPLVVNLAASAAGAAFNPTGIVFNASTDFVVTATASGAAKFIFAGEGGMIAGWSPGVDRTHAITAFTATDGAVYKGLAIASNGAGNFLFATDFHGNKVDVLDTHFAKQTASATVFPFIDPTLPAGYAPFGIQALNTGAAGATQIYVTYAQQNGTDNLDQTNGAGLGLVDIFDTNGVFVSRLVTTGGVLNAPWGVALAPADFGTLSNAVLVGNFGDGKINAFATGTGASIGAVTDSHGAAFAQPGLWGIAFGNDAANQPHNTLFFSAGVNDQVNGEFGRIDAGGAPVLNAPPVVTLTAPTGTVSGTVNVSATVQSSVAIAKVEFFAGGISLGSVTTAPFTTTWDTTTIADGTVAVNAKATDVDGNVGVVAADVVVSNAPAPAAVTLSQLQAAVFTPKCSGCHNGSNPPGGALPGSQNLTAGNTFAAIVGVASLEQPALRRVKAGDPDNSYLIQKLEGLAGITGSRMPLGGPFLDQATIDQIKAWIASGAPNN